MLNLTVGGSKMTAKNDDLPKIKASNTKKEMLEAFNLLKQKFQEKSETEMKPEKEKRARKEQEIVQIADIVASDSVVKRVNDLKVEIGTSLSDITGKLEEETERYNKIKEAIDIKNKELQELFEIDNSAFTLAALLESQKQKKLEFESEIEQRKKLIEDEINLTKAQWEKEKKEYLDQLEEQKKENEKIRKRQKEEYEYNFNREQEQKKSKLKDEIEQLTKNLEKKKEDFEKKVLEKEDELLQRDLAISEREKIVGDLHKRVDAFPKELETKVNQAVKEATDALKADAKKNEELIVKGFEGEKNVLMTKIESLEKVVDVQKKQIETLSKQLENAYSKVQDIAVKAVAGSQNYNITGPYSKDMAKDHDKS
jgi:hypothetical protein